MVQARTDSGLDDRHDEMRKALSTSLRTRTRDHALTEDITQDVLLKWLEIERNSHRDLRPGYLVVAAQRRLISDWRRKKVRRFCGGFDWASDDVEPWADASRQEIVQCVRSAVESLPRLYRTAIETHYFAPTLPDRTPANTSIGRETEKSRIHRARQMLRARLAHLVRADKEN
jgi:DNA-directed RNA polymerase specialized sigma24 family protein